MPVTVCRPWRIFSMLRQNSTPSAKPSSVPVTPMLMPEIRKTRITEPREAPMVRRMAMSGDLSFTSITRPEMMLSAATRMISDRIRNITLRSISTTSRKPLLKVCQGLRLVPGPAAFVSSGMKAMFASGSVTITSIAVTPPS